MKERRQGDAGKRGRLEEKGRESEWGSEEEKTRWRGAREVNEKREGGGANVQASLSARKPFKVKLA